MKGAGWDIAPYQGNDAWILPIPATFVVGRDSIIRARFVDPDYRKRMAIEVIVDAYERASGSTLTLGGLPAQVNEVYHLSRFHIEHK
jgi:hypothetical protein